MCFNFLYKFFSETYLILRGINHSNAKLNLICHLLSLIGARHILHVSRIRVKRDAIKIYVGLYVKYPLFLFDFNET
jgi:hypothetical protein